MLEIVAAVNLAAAAFEGIKKVVSTGREMQDCAQFFGQFFDAKTKIAQAEERQKNPPLFGKLFAAGSVEEEALQITVQKQKMLEMEKELRSMIVLAYGQQEYIAMMRMRETIKKQRAETERKLKQRRKEFWEIAIYGTLILVLVVIGMWIAYVVVKTMGAVK